MMDGRRAWTMPQFGWKPIVSSRFCYSENMCASWFDAWLKGGGTIARDTVDIRRADDLPDLRTTELQALWSKNELKLRRCRRNQRLTELVAEARTVEVKPKLRVVK